MDPFTAWKTLLTALVIFSAFYETTSSLPSSECYALDRENYLYDFTDKVGKELELQGKRSDFVLRFCVDAQNRSQSGYINYGRFSPRSSFTHGFGDVDFFQEYKYGDLMLCEHNGYELTGREAEVKIICGTCPVALPCKDDFGCICNATYHHNMCKAEVLVAVNCSGRGPRIFPGFSVGFKPRGWEVVKNGITQWAFRKPYHNYSYETNQRSVLLYMTATAESASSVEKPLIQVQPANGLSVKLSGTAAIGGVSKMKSPILLEVNWQCEIPREKPYDVKITVPLKGYDPVEFFLSKLCENKETHKETGKRLKIFESITCIFLVVVSIFGCAGVAYKSKVQHKLGWLEALPAVCLLSETLEKVHDDEDSYQPINEIPMT